MKKNSKRLLTSLGSFTIGAGLIAAGGMFMLKTDQPEPIVHNDPIPPSQARLEGLEFDTSVTESPITEEDIAVISLSLTELPEGSTAKKAKLDDYKMLLKIDKKKSDAEKKAEKSTEEVKAGDTNAYDAVYDSDTTKIYDPQPEPLKFTQTRSVKDEYFTVNDIISGGVVTMNAHDMLCQIVNNEIGGDWDKEAIKAQAVAAYSFLRFNDTLGLTPEVGLKPDYSSRIEKYVSQVEGQAVFYDNKIINAVYSASTAGYSVESERIWDIYYPYLRAVVSEYDDQDPHYGEKYVFTEAECRSLLESTFGISISDDVNKWFVMDDIYSGRYVGFITIDGQKRITAREFQDAFGLHSQAFKVALEDGKVIIYTFGWGHGVGMSQWGAHYYAENGYTYDQILRHYYLNTTVALSKESSKAVRRGAPYRTSSASSSDS